MAVNFELYRTFYFAAKHKNLTSAAKALYVTQPTVTHAIQLLERELGCTLFVRSQKGVALTPEAQMLFDHVSAAYEHLMEAEEQLNSLKELSTGTVSIGASETTLHHYLIPYLVRYRKAFPQIRLRISNSNTPETLNAIRSGTLDLAVLVMQKNCQNSDLSVTHLSGFTDILIANNDYRDLKGRLVTLKELLSYPLVCMGRGTVTREYLDLLFSDHHLELEPDIELATSDLIVPMVLNGLGIGFVPEPFAANHLADNSIFQINLKEQLPKREICLICKPDTPLSIAAENFKKMLCG
ncbi:MAG: LysR family transcriptional regulator [Clostridiaceae bacterium]|nr:LysR family transcriptional regulator [Clostridiaceae bacterium]